MPPNGFGLAWTCGRVPGGRVGLPHAKIGGPFNVGPLETLVRENRSFLGIRADGLLHQISRYERKQFKRREALLVIVELNITDRKAFKPAARLPEEQQGVAEILARVILPRLLSHPNAVLAGRAPLRWPCTDSVSIMSKATARATVAS